MSDYRTDPRQPTLGTPNHGPNAARPATSINVSQNGTGTAYYVVGAAVVAAIAALAFSSMNDDAPVTAPADPVVVITPDAAPDAAVVPDATVVPETATPDVVAPDAAAPDAPASGTAPATPAPNN